MYFKIDGIGCVKVTEEQQTENHTINPAAWALNEETGLAECVGPQWVYSEERHWQNIRLTRVGLLEEVDELIKKAEDTNPQMVDAYRAYRQALRDVPQTYVNPADVVWPNKPMGV